jgi:hypothetical protein
MGKGTVANGRAATAIGYYTTAPGWAQLALGQYNIGQGDAGAWVPTDDVFIIGNGTSDTQRSNAFTVKKNGDTQINGKLDVAKNAKITHTEVSTIPALEVVSSSGVGASFGSGAGLRVTSGDGGVLQGSDINHSIFFRKGRDNATDVMDFYEFGKIRFYTGGHIQNQLERMCIMSDGNVGIGVSSPQAKLHVNETVRFDGNLTGNGTDNRLPNQATLPDGKSIVTRDLADARYLTPAAATTTYVRHGFIGDTGSVAIGVGSYSSNFYSVAVGDGATATGTTSVAMGNDTTASGEIATALGTSASATGNSSVALGDATASGTSATAVGTGAVATNIYTLAMHGGQATEDYAVAIGRYFDSEWTLYSSVADGYQSIAINGSANGFRGVALNGVASGEGTIAIGDSSVTGDGAIGIGGGYASGNSNISLNASSAGDYSVAIAGALTDAYSAIAIGQQNASDGSAGFGDYAIALNGSATAIRATALNGTAAAGHSTALGSGSIANGQYSAAIGQTTATAFRSNVLGSFNVVDSGQNTGAWVAGNELLVVGNGTASNAASNALVMRKNANMRTGGDLEAKGVIRCAPGGGLSMGTFTEGQNPSTLDAGLKYSGE